ncbi:MAG: hypothetical protein JWN24_4665 [Phycisphaerales bacterium]|nr:hypothetical protein [Phycisphaerales bacterium]
MKRIVLLVVALCGITLAGTGCVLFIKANLNAQAIASLKGTELDLGGDIDKLIKEMEASIAEADAFIAQTHTEK